MLAGRRWTTTPLGEGVQKAVAVAPLLIAVRTSTRSNKQAGTASCKDRGSALCSADLLIGDVGDDACQNAHREMGATRCLDLERSSFRQLQAAEFPSHRDPIDDQAGCDGNSELKTQNSKLGTLPDARRVFHGLRQARIRFVVFDRQSAILEEPN